MQKLEITNLGPVKACSIDVSEFMVLTGAQASGKSTVAKSIYFFNNLKNLLFSIYQKRMATDPSFEAGDVLATFSKEVQKVFAQSFDIRADYKSYGMVCYEYDNGSSIVITFEPGDENLSVVVTPDENMKANLKRLAELLDTDKRTDAHEIRSFIYSEVFASDMDVVYIPAGRSMLTVLSSQINYLYSVMDDRIRAMMDYCTQGFIGNVLLLREYFNKSYNSILKQTVENADYEIDVEKAKRAIEIMGRILGGEYRAVNGEERLYFGEDYVKINYASSGQQEATWIVNMLFYYMLGRRKAFFIIEEPEAHLFPDTQKAVIELISLVKNGSNRALITTHSPYVLGSINNLLYAKHISNEKNGPSIEALIPKDLWLDFNELGAYYLEAGQLRDIRVKEYADIDHDVIDGVSGVINDEYEKLLEIAGKE